MTTPRINDPSIGGVRRGIQTSAVHELERQDLARRGRATLTAHLSAARKTASQATREAGLSPNTLHNFLNGESDGLSIATISKLENVLPGILGALAAAEEPPADDLATELSRQDFGPAIAAGALRKRPGAPKASHMVVTLREEARPGVWTDTGRLPAVRRRVVGADVDPRWSGAFGVLVAAGADQAYRAGTLLVCVPPASNLREIAPGRHVTLACTDPKRRRFECVELTVREVVARDGGLALALPSAAIEDEVRLPDRFDGAAWSARGRTYAVKGIVMSATQRECG